MALGKVEKDVAEDYVNDFINELNSSGLQSQSFGLVEKLTTQLEQKMSQAIESQDSSFLSNFAIEENQEYSKQSAQAQSELNRALQALGIAEQLHEILLNTMPSLKNKESGVTDTDLLNWVHYYGRKFIYASIKEGRTVSGLKINKSQLAGYFEEALIHRATSKLSEHIGTKTSALMTGATKATISTGQKVDTVFDIYLNFLSNDLDKTFSENLNIDTNSLTSGFGIQSKLRNLPWYNKNPATTIPIASNDRLYNLWQEKRSWVKGVVFLQSHVNQAMGDNVLYVFGNSISWTDDLIREFRDREYYLAFHFKSMRVSTNKIAWETIKHSKVKIKKKR